MYELSNTLDECHTWQQSEVGNFVYLFYQSSGQDLPDLGKLASTVTPAVGGCKALGNGDKEILQLPLAAFVRIYSFVTQVCRMFDKELHTFLVYAKSLYKVQTKGDKGDINLASFRKGGYETYPWQFGKITSVR